MMASRLNVTGGIIAASLLILLMSCSGTSSAAKINDLEGFEEEPVVKQTIPTKAKKAAAAAASTETTKPAAQGAEDLAAPPINAASPEQQQQSSRVFQRQDKYVIEIVALVVLCGYLVNILSGRQKNKRIAYAWASAFTSPGGVFDRNFAYTGPSNGSEGGIELMKESGNIYKLYASGRRYCQGLLATLTLRARQDVLTMLWNLVSPAEDQVELTVYMAEASMPPIVLAVATPKAARALQRDQRDIERYTKKITISKDQMPSWPHDRLHVLAEHSSLFYDLFSDPKVQQLFSLAGPHGRSVLQYFRSMHFTSENSEGSRKRVLHFTFALPPAAEMESMARLMDMVPLFIDLVGTFKLNPELKKKALDARTHAEERAEDEARKKRLEALQNKKVEKLQEEKMKMSRMSPEARQKYEEKMQRAQAKKQMNKRVVRA